MSNCRPKGRRKGGRQLKRLLDVEFVTGQQVAELHHDDDDDDDRMHWLPVVNATSFDHFALSSLKKNPAIRY
jgi:hypothetical protein